MSVEKYENYREVSEHVRSKMGNISKTMLAGLLGVTERSLSDWEGRMIGQATPKALRLELLFKVVLFLEKEFPKVPHNMYREILDNSTFEFDNSDDEDGSISLIGMIVADPKNQYWRSIVKNSVSEYLRYIEFKGDEVEQGRFVRRA